MAFTLLVQPGWRSHVDRVWSSYDGIVPVVKGNGYGFGRPGLIGLSAQFGAEELAVGTVHELGDIPLVGPSPIVLTPVLPADLDAMTIAAHTIFTVGSLADVATLSGRGNRVLIKVASSMRRYGVHPDEVATVAGAATAAGLQVHGYAIHLPLPQPAGSNALEITDLLEVVPNGTTAYLSHLSAGEMRTLAAMHPHKRLRARVGTELWIGDKAHLKLVADVVDVRPIESGQSAGYRRWPADEDGHLVMVSAGSAHGVQALPDSRSPFHFAQRRLGLHEPPHMHTSMCIVPLGSPLPTIGDRVDVQQPLTRVWPDRVQFVS